MSTIPTRPFDSMEFRIDELALRDASAPALREPHPAPDARLSLTLNVAPTRVAGRSVAGSTDSVPSCVKRGTSASSRKGFGNLLEALHDSRRGQAAREIHRYQHLARE